VPGTVPAWAVAPTAEAVQAVYRVAAGGGSLIGDALLRELTEGGRTIARPVLPPSERGAVVATRDSSGRAGTGAEDGADDPLFGPLNADGSRRPDRPRPPDAGRIGSERPAGSGGPAGSGAATDSRSARWHSSAGRSPLLDDTVVLDVRGDGRPEQSARRFRVDGRGPVAADGPDAPRPAHDGTRAGGRSADGPSDGSRPHDMHPAQSDGAGNGTVPAMHPPAAHPPPITAAANGAHADPPYRTGAHQNGALQNGAHQHGARQNGAHRTGGHQTGGHQNGAERHGMHGDGAHREGAHGAGDHRNGAADRPPRDGEPAGDLASTVAPTRSDGAEGSRPARRGTSGRGPGRPPSTDTDGLGLADLLAGALAEYRNL
jgi:hypothetical protein